MLKKHSDGKQLQNVRKAHKNIKLNSIFWTRPIRDVTFSKLSRSGKNISHKKLSVEHTPFSKWLDIFSMNDKKLNTIIDCFRTSFCIDTIILYLILSLAIMTRLLLAVNLSCKTKQSKLQSFLIILFLKVLQKELFRHLKYTV